MALRQRNELEAKELYQQAFELEQEAALTFLYDLENEPTRSVVFRSAASLALLCGKWRAAEKLTATGLSGNPPAEIADELRDLFEKVNVKRKLERTQMPQMA